MTSGRCELSRRHFLTRAGQAAVAASVTASWAVRVSAQPADDPPDNPLPSDRTIRIGVVGGGFGASFHWDEHPNCIVQAVSDLRTDRRDGLMKKYRCERSYESLEKMILDPQIEAIAVFTGAPDHARHCIAVMNAGKHVLCAVPAAQSIEECEQLLEAKRRTGRAYMMAETSYYRYYTIAARELYRQGKFGELFYSEVEYYHPKDEAARQRLWYEGRPTWRYGLPPMFYPTHSLGFLVGVTKERITHVSCLGWGNPAEETVKENAYQNPFNAESALMRTDRGHMCRCNVFWEGKEEGERAQWHGTKLTFLTPSSGGQPFAIRGEGSPGWSEVPKFWERLPKALRHESGHGGSHTFLTHEFIAALVEEREPAIDIYESLAMTAPGLVAHRSALKGGEQLKVRNFDKRI